MRDRGIGLGVVGVDEAQEGALAAAVGAGQGPVFPFPHGPVQGIQDDPLAKADGHVPETDDGGRQDAVQVRFPRLFLPRLPVFDRNDTLQEEPLWFTPLRKECLPKS